MKSTTTFALLLPMMGLMAALFYSVASAQQPTADAGQTTEIPTAETESEQDKQGSFWMEQKLRLSKELLTGLANGDFDAIGKNAQIMRGLNRVEKFVRRGPEGYRDYLRQFNMANEALIDAAGTENLEGATLAFNQLTISCVNCHKHLRETE